MQPQLARSSSAKNIHPTLGDLRELHGKILDSGQYAKKTMFSRIVDSKMDLILLSLSAKHEVKMAVVKEMKNETFLTVSGAVGFYKLQQMLESGEIVY